MVKPLERIDYKIRPARTADRKAIAEISEKVFSIYGNYREYLPTWTTVPDIVTMIAESDGEPAGFLMIGFFEARDNSRLRYADILAIAVDPTRQGRGLGKSLLSSAILMLEGKRKVFGISEVRLTVADSNSRAQGLFQRFGFDFTGEADGRYEGGQTALRMRRPLK